MINNRKAQLQRKFKKEIIDTFAQNLNSDKMPPSCKNTSANRYIYIYMFNKYCFQFKFLSTVTPRYMTTSCPLRKEHSDMFSSLPRKTKGHAMYTRPNSMQLFPAKKSILQAQLN